jgi:ceramide glucosyltransferase
MALVRYLLAIIGMAGLAATALHAVLALVAVLAWQIRAMSTRSRRANPAHMLRLPPVTVLKPLCGAEPGLYRHLRSFCLQDYPEFQIVFGVRDAADPALEVAVRLAAEFPQLPIDIVVDPRQHGGNGKTSNLINMLASARHDMLAIADSDTSVGPDYLATVTTPLLNERVGLVTSTYHDVPTPLIWSRLGAMYINEWYMPSVLITWLFGYQGYAGGQTLCLRRNTLEQIGGLAAIADHLADDYRLNELIRAHGLRTVLSPAQVAAEHHEPALDSLIHHETRWMRTIRVLRPRSFNMLFVSFSLPTATLGLLLAAAEPAAVASAAALFWSALVARLGLHFVHRLRDERPVFCDIWLLPVRDLLLCWVWYRSFFASRVNWRGLELDVDANGVVRRQT